MTRFEFNPATGGFDEKPSTTGGPPIFTTGGGRWSLGSWVLVRWSEERDGATWHHQARGLVTAAALGRADDPSQPARWKVGVAFVEPCPENPPVTFEPHQCAPCAPPEGGGSDS